MTEENRSQIFILKSIDETRTYFIQEINHNDLMSKKYKNVFTVLNYIEQSLILTSTVTRCVSISASAFLVSIPTDISGSAVALKFFAISAGIKKYNSIMNKIIRSLNIVTREGMNNYGFRIMLLVIFVIIKLSVHNQCI